MIARWHDATVDGTVRNACQLDLLGRVDPQAIILGREATRLHRLTHSKPRVDAFFD
jgi:hypothetical protein